MMIMIISEFLYRSVKKKQKTKQKNKTKQNSRIIIAIRDQVLFLIPVEY